MSVFKKAVLSVAMIAASTAVLASEVYNGDDEYYESYPEVQPTTTRAAYVAPQKNPLSVFRLGYVSSAEDNLAVEDVFGLSFVGEKYNVNNLAFTWRLNLLGTNVTEVGGSDVDFIGLDYSLGFAYGLPINSLNLTTGIPAVDNSYIIAKASVGGDLQSMTLSNSNTGAETDISMFGTYFKLGAGVRIPVLNFWDVELMLENITVSDYSVENDFVDMPDVEAEESGVGISIASNLYFNANKDFGIGFEMHHGVHNYTTLSMSKRY